MLDLNNETVCRLIELARGFHYREQVVIPEASGNPGDDWAHQLLVAHAHDSTLREFRFIVPDPEP